MQKEEKRKKPKPEGEEGISSPADDGKVHLRTGLKLCTGKKQAGRETLTSRHLPVALTPYKNRKARGIIHTVATRPQHPPPR
jgi:hypothetical protein